MGSWSVEIQLIVWTNRVKHISENSGVIFLLFYAHQIRLSSRWDCGNCELLRHPARHEAASYCTILITRRFCWRCCHTDDIDWNDFSISKSTQHQEITYIYIHTCACMYMHVRRRYKSEHDIMNIIPTTFEDRRGAWPTFFSHFFWQDVFSLRKRFLLGEIKAGWANCKST